MFRCRQKEGDLLLRDVHKNTIVRGTLERLRNILGSDEKLYWNVSKGNDINSSLAKALRKIGSGIKAILVLVRKVGSYLYMQYL